MGDDSSTGFFESVGQAWDDASTYVATHTGAEVGHDVDEAADAALYAGQHYAEPLIAAPMDAFNNTVDSAVNLLTPGTDEVGEQARDF